MPFKTPLACALLGLLFLCQLGMGEDVVLDSLVQLNEYAGKSGNQVTMKPGKYFLTDLIPLESIPQRRKDKRFTYIDFSGNNNRFQLDGVEIIADTAIREALRPSVHSNEFVVGGDHNQIHGLTITNTGNGKSPGGALVSIVGDDNTLSHCTFTVRGSFPYGYGDLFGKGGQVVIGHRKHSGVQILGSRTKILDCRLFVRSFGHGFFVQGGANQHFENCYVEGEMRSTTEILQETDGPAHDAKFQMVLETRSGDHTILPGYTKAQCEDGYRTYNAVKNLTLVDCVAKNMRGGFELRTKGGGVLIKNCESTGCERGYWVGNGATIEASRGDLRFGPLLYLEGQGAQVNLTCIGKGPQSIVHAAAAISGSNHVVTISATSPESITRHTPILVGFSAPPAGEGMCFLSARSAEHIVLENNTTAPVVVQGKAATNRISSQSEVVSDDSPRR